MFFAGVDYEVFFKYWWSVNTYSSENRYIRTCKDDHKFHFRYPLQVRADTNAGEDLASFHTGAQDRLLVIPKNGSQTNLTFDVHSPKTTAKPGNEVGNMVMHYVFSTIQGTIIPDFEI